VQNAKCKMQNACRARRGKAPTRQSKTNFRLTVYRYTALTFLLCASFQETVSATLLKKVKAALVETGYQASGFCAGGVAANSENQDGSDKFLNLKKLKMGVIKSTPQR